jgi:hypothetical protein
MAERWRFVGHGWNVPDYPHARSPTLEENYGPSNFQPNQLCYPSISKALIDCSSVSLLPGLGTPLVATSPEMVTPQNQSFNRDIFQVFRGMYLKHFSSSIWHASVQNVAFFESLGVHVAQRNGEVAIAQRSSEES